MPCLQNPFFTGVVHGVEAALYQAGYTLQIGHFDGLPEREQELQIPAGGNNGKLVVMIGGEGNQTFSVTWNGTALTPVAGTDYAGSAFAYVFTLDNPAPGTGPLVVTKNGDLTRYGVAALYATGVVGEVQVAAAGLSLGLGPMFLPMA